MHAAAGTSMKFLIYLEVHQGSFLSQFLFIVMMVVATEDLHRTVLYEVGVSWCKNARTILGERWRSAMTV